MKNIKWISSTENGLWQEQTPLLNKNKGRLFVETTGETDQIMDGFGGCFNELGWIALSKANSEERKKVFENLFGLDECDFSFCRMPVGANDFSERWYSYNETPYDYQMEHFSIERDYHYLIPYINEAKKVKKEFKMFASPWSPPTWMKERPVYNTGAPLRMEPNILKAYALYFEKFIRAYANENITIHQIHVQNEPFANQNFPSCLWKPEQFKTFIGEYLGPHFKDANLDTEIWLGTLNGPFESSFNPLESTAPDSNYERYVSSILFDKNASMYIKGVGYQWDGKSAIDKTHQDFPTLKLMQTESECGMGTNDWRHAEYIFSLINHYCRYGSCAYIYWNMALEQGGLSTWGWPQNSLVTVNPDGTVTYNPEFYVIKHFSYAVKPGAKYLKIKGPWASASSAFLNPDGSIAVLVHNAQMEEHEFSFCHNGESFSTTLKPHSLHTFIW
jgi:glucosylceramidase